VIDFEAIRDGFSNGEFFLEYLPTISLETNSCIGAEALIRWRRGSEVVLPDDFIPAIENTVLSGLVTYWVIETVAKELGAWLRVHDRACIAINVPPEILGRGGLRYAVQKSGLMDVARNLILEVTERGVPDKLGIDALNNAQRYGARVALDDVGMEGSNLVVLARCRVDIIKIDKSVIKELEYGRSSTVVQGIAMLMNVANLDIIAEGVESAMQVTALKEIGIKMAQGWHFSHSLSAKNFKAFYRTRH
jgi:sensor c-di-GMP phosphodiesterase-like protein